MNLDLSNLNKSKGHHKSLRRIGRGYGSTKGGHTSGSGMKGQKSRNGGKTRQWFEGGQTPLIRKMPYRGGFINHAQLLVIGINLGKFSGLSEAASKRSITPAVLVAEGIVKEANFNSIKILGKGSVDTKLNFSGFKYSKRAIEKIKNAGGSIS